MNDADLVRVLTLPFKLSNGNTGRGYKWYNSAKERKNFEAALRASFSKPTPFPFPVKVRVTRILGKRQQLWDYSSIGRGNWKEIEDAMVAVGWFHDDGPKWIKGVTFEQDNTRRDEGPAVLVEIFEARD